MLEEAKRACRVSAAAYDDEIRDLIEAAKADMMAAGIKEDKAKDEDDPLVRMAIKTYCRANFGSPPDYERLKASYDEQKAQLQGHKPYARWGNINVEG
jgi:uncharacterized phage protein (predicted DNA packaging)